MATIRRITPSNPVSGFSTYQPRTAGAFDVLATVAETAWERADPLAREDAKQMGEMAGYEAAKGYGGGVGLAGPSGGMSMPGISGAAQEAFDRLQQDLGMTLRVTSGYRDPEHNARVGGAKNSQHIQGNAFDIDVSGVPQAERVRMIERARAAGFSGIGVYDNTLHFDIGGDRAWGPSYSRDSLPAWAASAVSAPLGTMSVPMVATKDPTTGELKPIPEAAFSGPYKALYDNAAQIAYQAELILRGGDDLQALALQHPYDPNGFQIAADRYVAEMVGQVPDHMKPDVEARVASDARRLVLGLQADKMRDIENRANNASAALAERYATAFAEADASGDAEAAAAALTQLDSVLRARESLPGSGWTPEQSANAIIGAQRQAIRLREQRQSDMASEIGDNIDLAIDAAIAGRQSEFDALAMSDTAMSLHPEKVRELQAYRQINDSFDDFARLSKPQRDAAVASMMAQPVSEEWQIAWGKAVQTKAQATDEAWAERTIETAREHAATRPPELELTIDDPTAAATSMRRRRDWTNAVIGSRGITENPLYLDETEAQTLRAALDPTMDPAIRLITAQAIAQGFGPDAERVWQQLDIDDPVLMSAGTAVARGLDPKLMVDALGGQALIREGAVKPPTEAQIRAIPGYTATAQILQTVPNSTDLLSDLSAVASAIYAKNALGLDPESAEAKTVMENAWQSVLGRNTEKGTGKVRGGLMPVHGQDVLLPTDIAASDLELAVSRAMNDPVPSTVATDLMTLPSRAGQAVLGAVTGAGDASPAPRPNPWEAAGGVPYYAGAPLTASQFRQERVQFVPLGDAKRPHVYRMTIDGNPVVDSTNRVLAVDLKKLIDATQPAPRPLWQASRQVFPDLPAGADQPGQQTGQDPDNMMGVMP